MYILFKIAAYRMLSNKISPFKMHNIETAKTDSRVKKVRESSQFLVWKTWKVRENHFAHVLATMLSLTRWDSVGLGET